ncbi:hypothetical protein LF887_04430 [Chryseobacterium sp. MEBOG06]|uniref:hypothetical protein n=1 Tax=Chryseobacterium sp. MEBOG06 TaxID=2879938 RepID=UPI001F3A4957|nr:hypothetical protein [Chryseobacterium sp. MEBOG06]UKB84884.1 hypothetical protein LF887_04430 [Chryseobacterium sp. MEBOG06]
MLKDIKNELEELGYNSNVRIIDNKECLYSYIEGNLNSVFFIKDVDKKLKIEYFTGQIPVEKEFKTIEELMKFVRQVFPLEG